MQTHARHVSEIAHVCAYEGTTLLAFVGYISALPLNKGQTTISHKSRCSVSVKCTQLFPGRTLGIKPTQELGVPKHDCSNLVFAVTVDGARNFHRDEHNTHHLFVLCDVSRGGVNMTRIFHHC